MQFKVGDRVTKVTGDYNISGIVRSVFTMENGAVRVVVEHKAEGGGSFLHVYGEANLVKTFTANSPRVPVEIKDSEEVKKLLEEAVNRFEKSKDAKCLWTGVKPGTPMGMSCPCPKCTPYS